MEETVKKELGGIIAKEIDLLPGVLLTITGIEVSKDVSSAKIFVSVFPEKENNKILGILAGKAGDLQKILNKRIRTRWVPRIRFVEDKELREGMKAGQILENMEK